MGWNFRKSTKIGPFRITASKKGIGWSVGSKYMRYGKSATGKTYVSTGSNGFYYRKTLSNGKERQDNITDNTEIQETSSVFPVAFVGLIILGLSPIAGLIFSSWTVSGWMAAIGLVVFFGVALFASFENHYSDTPDVVEGMNVPTVEEKTIEDEFQELYALTETLSEEEKVNIFISKGIEYENKEYIELSIKCYEYCVDLKTKKEAPYRQLISLYKKLGKLEEVRRIAEIGLQVFPSSLYFKRILQK